MFQSHSSHMDSAMERFIEDINECVEAINKVAAIHGKELTHLNVNPQLGQVKVVVEDVHPVH